MTPDRELLRLYAEKRDEAAFAEVVRRHLNLVYALAVRSLNGNAALAEDVTQAVFTDLARKAAQLRDHITVAGWLHTSVRFAAAKAIRDDECRRTHEQEASAMNETTAPAATVETASTALRPLLDEAVGQLREPERDAVLLRFFEDKSYREVGDLLGLSENTARMRVERALDKLRAQFSRRGVATTAALLASALGAHGATTPAPTSFAGTIPAKSIAGAATAGAAGISRPAIGNFAQPKMLLMATMLILLVAFVALQLNANKPAQPAAASAPQAQAAQIEQPKMAAAPASDKPSPPTAKPPTSDALGEIQFKSLFGTETFILESGLTFEIGFLSINPNGTLALSYYFIDPKNDNDSVPIGGFGLEDRRAYSTESYQLNFSYIVAVTPGVPAVVKIENGETVTFTPAMPVFDTNSLGDLDFTQANTLVFTLHSGKILTLMLNGAFLEMRGYLSKQDYEAKKVSMADRWSTPEPGRETEYPVTHDDDNNEVMSFTPHYPNPPASYDPNLSTLFK